MKSDEEIQSAVKESFTMAEALAKLGLRPAGGNYKTLRRRIAKLGLSTQHWLGQAHLRGKTHGWARKRSLEAILIEHSPHTHNNDLKRRLIREGVLPNCCKVCGLTEWLGKPLVLHLDHINGVNDDNRLSNLRLLCPNCHSQTDTYCGRNIRQGGGKVDRPVLKTGAQDERAGSNPAPDTV